MSFKEVFCFVFLYVFIYNNCNVIAQKIEIEKTNYAQLFSNWNDTFYEGETNVINLTCPPLDTVRIAVIGLGNRGQMALERLPKIQGVKIIAISRY